MTDGLLGSSRPLEVCGDHRRQLAGPTAGARFEPVRGEPVEARPVRQEDALVGHLAQHGLAECVLGGLDEVR